MNNPNDATIDIPLSKVETKTGARRPSWEKHQAGANGHEMNEKTGFYQRHVAGRRKTAKKTGRGDDGENDTITQMGHIYNKILNFSIVTRYFLYVLPVAFLISIPIIIGATAKQDATMGGVRIVWIFSWLLIVWLSLWVSKLVAKFLPAIFQFLCGIVSSGTRKYSLVIRALEIYLSLCGWALTSLATFIPVMTHNPTQSAQAKTYAKDINSPDRAKHDNALLYKNAAAIKPWESVVQKTLAAFLVATLILLAEKLLIQLISIGYHRTQFNAKIQGSKHRIHLLSLLYQASRNLFPAYCPEFAQEDYVINDSIELGDGHAGQRQSGSATPMRLLQNVGRFGDKVTSVFGNLAQEVTGKEVFNPNSPHSIVVEALEKNRSAEALAKRLWMSFVVEGKEALYREDIVEVLGPDLNEEAEEAFSVLDRDGNGDISLDEMILTVCEFGKERHSISNSLHDVDQAIHVLDNLLCTVVLIMCIFVFVAFLNSSFTTTLATAGTAILSLSFVFAATAQEVLGSCIFLFVKHPFDVLDRVDVGTDQLVVKHISLLFTVFQHVSSHKRTQVPNVVLNGLWIQNISRSEAMREQLQIFIGFDTTLEDLQLLRNELHTFVMEKDNSRDFQPDVNVEITGIAAMDKMELTVEIRHKSNWANETVRAARRSKFMCALVLALRKIPIYAPGGGGAALGSVDQPTYTVAVSNDQAAVNRKNYDDTKDKKRLYPNNKPDVPDRSADRGFSTGADSTDPRDSATPPPLRFRQPPASESNALNTLNSRHPAADTADHPRDYVEPTTPKSLARSISGATETTDLDRTASIEEVRGILRRESTKGKRRQSGGSAPKKIRPIAEQPDRLPRPYNGPGLEYDPYAYTSYTQEGAPPKYKEPATDSKNRQPHDQEMQTAWPQPPTTTHNPRPLTDQQRPPPSSQVRQAPPIAPPPQIKNPTPPPKDSEKSFGPSSQQMAGPRTFTNDPAQIRAPSPIRNPFQLHALRAQAQGVGVPRAVRSNSRPESQVSTPSNGAATPSQARRPVPGGGNAFAPRAQSQERSPQG
ncbi:uncharacterized protein KY384_005456 [Bacidia gigantensis]|uniref:uncharacterized protein n=1 Tax=Bacidia gigantensis TaxID=2732470 RepID=UPI001D03B740|nr:uncharacterized protein KY384_005456 [Bacidia gigantensis]KAG8529974.1 hypothetical protein KY384_005456 [Bacidia gigantensis]